MKRLNNFIGDLKIPYWEFIQFNLQWSIATFLGFAIALFFVEVGERSELGPIEGMLGGAMVGLMQALVLCQWFPQAWMWTIVSAIATTFLGSSSFGAIGWYAPQTEILSIRFTYGVTFGAIAGLWVGIWQWLVLKKYICNAWQWIFVNLSIWAVALPLGWVFGGMFRAVTHLFLGEVIGLILTWAIVSIVSGMALASMLSQTLIRLRKYGKKGWLG
jgi:hypothetical protein